MSEMTLNYILPTNKIPMENKCFMCENTSHDKALVAIEKDGEAKYVCVACLPAIIHG